MKVRKVIVFFDGDCGLCSRSVKMLHHLDVDDRLSFSPLQGETASGYAEVVSARGEKDSLASVRLSDGKVFFFSEGVRVALAQCGGVGWFLSWGMRGVPVGVRNWAYRFIALNRLRWFGTANGCEILAPELRAKLLP